jgi:hypothetical protein
MATTLKILSYPTTEAGVTLTTTAVAWAYSDWKPLAKVITQDIDIISLRFQFTLVMSADTTYEQLYEIGINQGSGIVTKIQLPISVRNDTAVGFYMTPDRIFLPEPYTVKAGASIYVRVATSVASAKTINGIKLQYQASDPNKSPLYQGVGNNYQFVEVGDGMMTTERMR